MQIFLTLSLLSSYCITNVFPQNNFKLNPHTAAKENGLVSIPVERFDICALTFHCGGLMVSTNAKNFLPSRTRIRSKTSSASSSWWSFIM